MSSHTSLLTEPRAASCVAERQRGIFRSISTGREWPELVNGTPVSLQIGQIVTHALHQRLRGAPASPIDDSLCSWDYSMLWWQIISVLQDLVSENIKTSKTKSIYDKETCIHLCIQLSLTWPFQSQFKAKHKRLLFPIPQFWVYYLQKQPAIQVTVRENISSLVFLQNCLIWVLIVTENCHSD